MKNNPPALEALQHNSHIFLMLGKLRTLWLLAPTALGISRMNSSICALIAASSIDTSSPLDLQPAFAAIL